MNQHAVNMISNRLSLRQPQRRSLEILDQVCDIISLQKGADASEAIQAVRSEFEQVEDFERDFPSLCFALATGVGKTRLMGAFISYLYLAENIRHFFVLAPNLTIYKKLIADFTPNTPKYVFQGVGEFATTPPVVITGDNYEDGHGVRDGYLYDMGEVHVNIFNISKINSEVRGGNAPRIKRLSEYIGKSYFDYLAGLDDLVMLMDESHRYRASAGVKAINELNPILGLELTATPQVEKGQKTIPFKNVIYSYPLSAAMNDGFVKEPAVATRQNFDAGNYTDEGLEKLKLEDGVRIHESTKVELEVYARNSEVKIVKPFMLVVAQDITHADALQQVIEDEEFFDGRYKGKVIQVHSNLRGEVKDDVVQQLLTVEDPANPVEIVIHVNMLKEGWDVTNLYTIVPLRAANSKTLVEQSIGRGLRLPYGKRVGVSAVDRLTIVSHDKFQEIVDHANDPDSIIRTGVVIGEDIPIEGRKAVEVRTTVEETLLGGEATPDGQERAGLFDKPEEKEAAKATLQVIREFEHLRRSADLMTPEVQAQITAKVEEAIKPVQGKLELEGVHEKADVAKVVKQTTEVYTEMSIDIPRIIVVPAGDVEIGYDDFDLDLANVKLQPVEQSILIQHLRTHEQYRLKDGSGIVAEDRPEDYLVRGLIDFNDICYDDHSGLLYKLSGQVVEHLRGYLGDEDQVINVLQYHQQSLVNLIHSQMQDHYTESATEYVAKPSKGFHTLKPSNFSVDADESVRSFRAPVSERAKIKSMIFGGFSKSLYAQQKFDSDSERRFSVVLENDKDVVKWVKPSKGDLRIHYSHEADGYEPDFVAETAEAMFLCEPKQANQMTDDTVLAKARAAATWCKHATDHCDKPWTYLLIPHDQIDETKTLAGLAASYTFDDVTV